MISVHVRVNFDEDEVASMHHSIAPATAEVKGGRSARDCVNPGRVPTVEHNRPGDLSRELTLAPAVTDYIERRRHCALGGRARATNEDELSGRLDQSECLDQPARVGQPEIAKRLLHLLEQASIQCPRAELHADPAARCECLADRSDGNVRRALTVRPPMTALDCAHVGHPVP